MTAVDLEGKNYSRKQVGIIAKLEHSLLHSKYMPYIHVSIYAPKNKYKDVHNGITCKPPPAVE